MLCSAAAPCSRYRGAALGTGCDVSGRKRCRPARVDELLARRARRGRGRTEPAPQFSRSHATSFRRSARSILRAGAAGAQRFATKHARCSILPELLVSVTAVRAGADGAQRSGLRRDERETNAEALAAAFEDAPGIIFCCEGIAARRPKLRRSRRASARRRFATTSPCGVSVSFARRQPTRCDSRARLSQGHDAT